MTYTEDKLTESEKDSSDELGVVGEDKKEKEKKKEEMWHPVLLCCGCKDGTDFSLFAV